jgi:Fe-S-cluster containining protein
MSSADPKGTDWTDQEIDLIVADYFDMLERDLAGQSYIKSQHNASLQLLTRRSHGSIERKHQNISAVLRNKLGLRWILGYKPLPNYQEALASGIEKYLSIYGVSQLVDRPTMPQLAENGTIFIGQAPAPERAQKADPPALQRLVRKFDPAVRDERNRSLGKRGEELVLISERARLCGAGCEHLAKKVRWVSQEDGDGAGYDILSFNRRGEERLLEVKTTTGCELTPFYVSANECALSEERPQQFRIYRLYDFTREPKAFKIAPPLRSALILETASYRASFS